MQEIEIIYLRHQLHPNITMIQTGPGIDRIVREGESYWIIGTPGGPLDGKKVEVPADNVGAIQWKLVEQPTT